jgi:putative ABC transport system permease protein
MLLLVLTLSLSAFTASLAKTLDWHLWDQMYYQVGGDVSLTDFGESTQTTAEAMGFSLAATDDEEDEDEIVEPDWLFLPVTEYVKAPGVVAATRIGDYKATTRLSGGTQKGRFLGVDRVDFPKAVSASWRWDYAPSSLGEMMNAMAITPDAVLLSNKYMRKHRLKPNDVIRLNVALHGQRAEMDMRVVGGFDYFPTWYQEEDGPLFVGNLDYLFEQVGGQYPYKVWLRTEPQVDYARLETDLEDLGYQVTGWNIVQQKIFQEQQNPGRQGLFGLLSVGFAAAALFTVLGFLLYALFSFRQRFIELGVLRAVGLSSWQMTIFLAWELAFLILAGLVLGTTLGVWMSQLFIPYLQIGADITALTPPFLVEVAWDSIYRIYLIFGLLFLIALAVLTALLLRMRIFEAVKLGETV